MPTLRFGTYAGAAEVFMQESFDADTWLLARLVVDSDSGGLQVAPGESDGTALSPATLLINATTGNLLRAFRMIGDVEEGCAIEGRVRSAPTVEDLPLDATPITEYPWSDYMDVFDANGVARDDLLKWCLNQGVTPGAAVQLEVYIANE
jgi:hypothetical protein